MLAAFSYLSICINVSAVSYGKDVLQRQMQASLTETEFIGFSQAEAFSNSSCLQFLKTVLVPSTIPRSVVEAIEHAEDRPFNIKAATTHQVARAGFRSSLDFG